VVLATEWDEFRTLDLGALAAAMAHPVLVDGRNLFDPETMRAAGFWYYPTGRDPVLQVAIERGGQTAEAVAGRAEAGERWN
jgi:UDPglucose 6-dehydrogenase